MAKKSGKDDTITKNSPAVLKGELEDINLKDETEQAAKVEGKPWTPFATFLDSLKDSVDIAFSAVKNHPLKCAAGALIAVSTGGIAVAGGVLGALAVGKVVKDQVTHYADANPKGKVAKALDTIKPIIGTVAKPFAKVWQVAKSVAKGVGELANTIKKNPWKTAALAVGGAIAVIATGGAALPFVVAGAAIGGGAMVTRNAVKHYKAATTPEQPSAEGKGATQTPNVKQSQQRATTSPPLTPPLTPAVNKGKSTGRGK
ncbi:MAG: hypothetical protein LN569_00405 [Rickettsia endosymbiont of Labidopullus appendiculatus]|nr:hypothetical protein [Rickettsia endosymbiont of Labidopullus appendiculatus]